MIHTSNPGQAFMKIHAWIVIENMLVKLLIVEKNEFMNTSEIWKMET